MARERREREATMPANDTKPTIDGCDLSMFMEYLPKTDEWRIRLANPCEGTEVWLHIAYTEEPGGLIWFLQNECEEIFAVDESVARALIQELVLKPRVREKYPIAVVLPAYDGERECDVWIVWPRESAGLVNMDELGHGATEFAAYRAAYRAADAAPVEAGTLPKMP